MTEAREKLAVILVDHGSAWPQANRLLQQVAELVRLARPGVAVYPAHMMLAEPTVAQAFERAVAGGAREIIVVPYFLAPGRHSRRDIPALVEKAAASYPGVAYLVTEPLGADELIVRLVWKRVDERTG